uniref:Uncharacterized protein n=1 Tax=Rhizophora mucronata TaxID=61149 RepID=A0A2P2NWI1_RHIMU
MIRGNQAHAHFLVSKLGLWNQCHRSTIATCCLYVVLLADHVLGP